MRYNAAQAVLATAIFAGSAYADAQSVLKDAGASASSAATEASSSVASAVESVTATSGHVLPTFTPTTVKADFLEQFTDDWEDRWKVSHAKKDSTAAGAKEDEEWAYVGEWAVEEPKVYKGMEGEKGLVIKNAGAHHAISAKFPKKIDNKGKTLVVQYEVKLQNGLECGGAYMKLLRDNKALHADEFSNASPYVVMFGPDKCGTTNRVHFIVNHKNPKTGKYEEKHMMSPPSANIVKTSELYTLIIHPNSTYVIKRNNNLVKEGSMLTDFAPAFSPEKMINDAKDVKPDDWVEEAKIADPEAKKPEDWDEDQPHEIVDDEATMPEGWLVDEPFTIPDPDAVKPEDWDDEEDGDFIAPSIPNPKGENAPGLGPWTKPMKKNDLFKGKWTAPFIDNPAYKGIWMPKQIKNPDYFEEKSPANLEPMGAIGFEIWTMQSDIMFDNIYIGHSIEDAAKLAEETWSEKHPFEELAELDDKPVLDEKKPPKGPGDLAFKDDPILYIQEKLDLFLTIAKADPIQAIKYVPEVAGGLVAALVLVLTILASVVGLLGGSAPAAPPAVKKAVADAKAQAKDVKEKVVDAAASGLEATKAEATKRKNAAQ